MLDTTTPALIRKDAVVTGSGKEGEGVAPEVELDSFFRDVITKDTDVAGVQDAIRILEGHVTETIGLASDGKP